MYSSEKLYLFAFWRAGGLVFVDQDVWREKALVKDATLLPAYVVVRCLRRKLWAKKVCRKACACLEFALPQMITSVSIFTVRHK